VKKDGHWQVDREGAARMDGHFVVMVAEGLGYGPEARSASPEAIGYFKPILNSRRRRCLSASTRRSCALAARPFPSPGVDYEKGEVAFAGLGNVAAQIYSGSQAGQHLVSMNGTAGYHARNFCWRAPLLRSCSSSKSRIPALAFLAFANWSNWDAERV
jgi:hypothetical protein